MAVDFDSEVGGASANSYATVSQYNQYRENHGLATVDTSDAEVQLIVATSWIESQYRTRWNTQNKTSSTQALHWPQSGSYYYDGTEIPDDIIPQQIKDAVYEYAITRASQSQTSLAPVESSNLKEQELDGVGRQEFFSQKSGYGLPDSFKFIDTILRGLISRGSSGFGTLNLYRAN